MTTSNPVSGTDSADYMPPRDSGDMDANMTDSGTSGLTDQAARVADSAKQTLGKATDTAQQQATQQAESRKGQAVSSLDQVARAFEQVGGHLRQNDQDQLGQVASMAAGQVNQLSGYLRQHSVGDLIDDVEDFARRQPEIFLVGAFLLGIAGARFLKASGSQARRGNRDVRSSDRMDWQRGSSRPMTSRPPMGTQAPRYGVYDRGSAGYDVREFPQ